MRWFKHLTMAHKDEALAAILEEMGPEGYGIYWLILEHFAEAMEKNCETVPELTYGVRTWAEICRCKTAAKFNRFCERATKLRLIRCETATEARQFSDKRVVKRLQICVPKLLKYRDEYSKKSGHTPDKLHPKSTEYRVQSTDREKEGALCAPKKAAGAAAHTRSLPSLNAIVAEFQALPNYRRMNVAEEAQKCAAYFSDRKIALTRQHLVNWLDRANLPPAVAVNGYHARAPDKKAEENRIFAELVERKLKNQRLL